MKKMLIAGFMVAFYATVNAQITKVQHFNAHIRDASALFKLFNQTFGLPVVYNYRQFSGFSSGGLWLGNITFEFVGNPASDDEKAIFKGIAFEPAVRTAAIVPMLDERRIAHSGPIQTTIYIEGQQQPFYTIVNLDGLTGDNRRVFICDYQNRAFINNVSVKADSALKANNGGPLGIVSLKLIVVGAVDKLKEAVVWEKIPGVKKVDGDLFAFSDGPAILLQQDNSNCVKEIVVKVQSKAKAAAFLSGQKLLKMENGRLLIDPAKVNGLRIVLEE